MTESEFLWRSMQWATIIETIRDEGAGWMPMVDRVCDLWRTPSGPMAKGKMAKALQIPSVGTVMSGKRWPAWRHSELGGKLAGFWINRDAKGDWYMGVRTWKPGELLRQPPGGEP